MSSLFQLVLDSPARSVDGEDMGVVDEPVDDGGGDHMIVEDSPPLIKHVVAREDGRLPLIAYGDKLEEEVRLLPSDGHITKFVNNEEMEP